MKPLCSINTCTKSSYCRGYCRNHYNSLIRHGDPLKAEQNIKSRQLMSEQRKKELLDKPKRHSNLGKVCKAANCNQPAKIKGYCMKHDARIKRNGKLEPKIKRSTIQSEECLVLGCSSKPKVHGICAHHLNNIKELQTPLKPKIVKLCGVKGCDKPHMAKGMCNTHYAQWKAVVRDYKLSNYVKLSGWDYDEI